MDTILLPALLPVLPREIGLADSIQISPPQRSFCILTSTQIDVYLFMSQVTGQFNRESQNTMICSKYQGFSAGESDLTPRVPGTPY